MALRIYKLTREGRRIVKVPGQERNPILDYLHEDGGHSQTATSDELALIVGKDKFQTEIRTLIGKGYVMEVT